jgi:hypothetical protein
MYWLTGLIGLASVAAPYLFGYTDQSTAYWVSVGFGGVVLALSGYEWYSADKEDWEYLVIALLGVGVIIAPFVMGFAAHPTALWTSVIAGGAAIVASGARLFTEREVT